MKVESLAVWKKNSEHYSEAVLHAYVLDGERNRPAVVICPGGGYSYLSEREWEAVALQFTAAGFHAFVVEYTVSPAYYRQPLLDLSQAVSMIRENAENWYVDPDKIVVCGFSAGGHLAASLGVHWSTVGSEVNQPNALILCYPVITSGPFAHRGSFDALLGSNPTPEMLKEMSLEKQVNENTPPTFIWHTVADSVVPVENTLLFAQALQSYNIPFEMHIFPNGDHGLSLATAETDDGVRGIHPHIASWITWCIEWLEELFELN